MLGLAGATGFTYRDVTRHRTTSAQPSELLPVYSLVLVVANVDLVGAAGGVSVRDEVWCTCVDVWEVRVRLVECALEGGRVTGVSLTPAPPVPELATLLYVVLGVVDCASFELKIMSPTHFPVFPHFFELAQLLLQLLLRSCFSSTL